MVVIFDDDEVFLGDHEIFAVHLVKNLRLQDLRGWGGGEEFGFEENQSIHPRADHIDVVRNQEDGQLQLIMKMLTNSITLCWVVISRPVVGSSNSRTLGC